MTRTSMHSPMRSGLAICLLGSLVGVCTAAEKVGPDARQLAATRTKAFDYLRSTQADDGSWTLADQPGIGGLVVYSLLESGLEPDDPAVAKGLKYLEGFVQKDGGIHSPKSRHRNYETCIGLLVFVKANEKGRYDAEIAAAKKFLSDMQWDEGEGLEDSDIAYGGAGYGGGTRPDLSNTAYLVEALHEAGVKEDDPAMKEALVFLSRCQNLESEHNQTEFAGKINDGGFFYTPAGGGSSQAGVAENGGLRSYASMTYAGLKSMIYAGLKPDDPRVKAASTWIRKHYTLDENPGSGQNGKFYYFHTMAKTLATLDVDRFEDASGTQHDWRAELTAKLVELQKENGSWINTAERWYEGDPNLATAFALMALAYCDPKEATPAGDAK